MRNMARIADSCRLGLEGGVAKFIEASGAEDAMLTGVNQVEFISAECPNSTW